MKKADGSMWTPEEWAAETKVFYERTDKKKQEKLWRAIEHEDDMQAANDLVDAVLGGAYINAPEPIRGRRIAHALVERKRWAVLARIMHQREGVAAPAAVACAGGRR